jgi:hypothetical protein
MRDAPVPEPLDPETLLPAPMTLRLWAGTEAIFTSERRWLHPLFDLEAFFAGTWLEPARTRLEDKVTGRAAAFLMARLGLRELDTAVLSRLAVPVLERHGIRFRCGELVDRIGCATEELLAPVEDVEAACVLLRARRARSLQEVP